MIYVKALTRWERLVGDSECMSTWPQIVNIDKLYYTSVPLAVEPPH